MKQFSPKNFETKWQQWWDEQSTYVADLHTTKKPYVAMSMFNYPSGDGIHIGHALNYTISDVMARFKRQQGYESYHPIGWDSFGLPAENFAIKTGVSPQASMAKIIPNYHKQYKAMGWSNDWTKEIATHEPGYYKWTQWIFSQMFKAGLAYQDARMQWWCEKCQTVLANEQIEANGKCWRHDSDDDVEVAKKEVKQWFFKITDYADELLEATDALDWTETVKTAQKNWIGKSKGAEVRFAIDGTDHQITVFTTRPDTLCGATFLVVAPEHDSVGEITSPEQMEVVRQYQKETAKKTEVERQASKKKTGVFTGAYATHPISGDKIPVWVSDYVLVGYGTGAIMAVPAHDERDNDFAKAFDLPIIDVVRPRTGTAQDNPQEKKSIVAIVRNPKNNTFLSINWGKDAGGNLFVGGGREENEDELATAIREITEETGYKNFVHVATTPTEIQHEYFAHSKNIAKRIDCYGLLFDLVDEEQVAPNLENNEQGKFSVSWIKRADVDRLVTDDLHKLCFDLLVGGELFNGEGLMINSGKYNGMLSSDARERIVADLAESGDATEKTIYKIRDWSVTRQRYWGAPTPIIHCPSCGPVLVPDEQLPVLLPELDDFAPSGDGRSALARATDWLSVACPQCGEMGQRETDTLDTYICSSWYMLRYLDPYNENKIFDSETINPWVPINFYNGGDHATAHMIYARFITRFLCKQGLVATPEPFKRFLFNGKVTAQNGEMFSKSKGNGVDPLEIIDSGYGADALRTYLMFASPLELWVKWDPQGVPGAYRFLNRVWNLVQQFGESEKDQIENLAPLRAVHPAIAKVTSDLEDQKYNTAIATMMKACNDLYEIKAKQGFAGSQAWREALEAMVMLIAPFAPHAAEELWHDLGHEDSVNKDHWPHFDEKYVLSDTLTLAVQVNGKVRSEITVSAEATEDEIIAAAKADEKVQQWIDNKPVKKAIYIKGRLVSIVV